MEIRLLVIILLLVAGTVYSCSRRRKSSKPRDRKSPVLVCPPDIRQHADPVQTNAWITWDEPVVTDNVDGNLRAYPCGRGPNQRYYGNNVITYRAQDKAGNVGQCSFRVDVYVVYCDPPPRIDNGYYHFYPSNDFRYGGTATYGCYPGYERKGNRVLTCQLNEKWSAAAPKCEKVQCSAEVLSGTIPYGKVHCTDQNKYQSKCHYTCDEGYRIKQGHSSVRVCGHLKRWLGTQPTCVDVTPPVIHNCPTSKIYYTSKGKDTALIFWYEPYAIDNSDESIRVTLAVGEVKQTYGVGSHKFKYTAVDSAGNEAKPCTFIASVRKLTCHTIYPTPGLTVTCEEGFGYGATCQFGCEDSLSLVGDREAECRWEQEHLVQWSWGHSQPTCTGQQCPPMNTPSNGAKACDNWAHGTFCKMFCNDKYIVPIGPEEIRALKSLVACGDDGKWSPRDKFPDCSADRKPNGFSKDFDLHLFSGDCCDESVTLDIQQKFIEALDKFKLCQNAGAECRVENIEVTCAEDQCQNSRRKKRSEDNFDLHVKGTMSYEPNGEDIDYETASSILNEGADNLANINTSLAVNMTLEVQSLKMYKTKALCEEGLQPTPYGTGCVGCESGTYFDLESDKCVFCPVGTYNDGSETTECISCPELTTTAKTGSKSQADCIDYCPPGKYSAHGTVPCTPCPVGSYSDVVQSTQCTQCPHAMTTSTEGSSALDQCQYYSFSVIPAANGSFGIVKNTTLSGTDMYISLKALTPPSTSPKPLLSIQDGSLNILSLILGEDILISVASMTTNISGQTLLSENWNRFAIHLSLGSPLTLKVFVNGDLFEDIIEVDIQEFSSPEIFIGSRTGIDEGYEITELNVWSTVNDDVLMNVTDECGQPNEGDILSWNNLPTTIDLNDAFINVLTTCDVSDSCRDKPCGNHTCIDGINSFICECNAGFTGDLCDENIDDCASHACENEATCMDGVETYSCVCTAGFTGEFCELAIIDGGWGEWSEWSTCTKSCNAGTQVRSRSCDQPQPGPDGADCSGESLQQQACNEQECVRCVQLEAPENGYLDCEYNDTNDLNTCTQHCNDGFAFPYEPLDSYLCGYETSFVWNNVTRLQCTEIEAPTSVSLEHSLVFPMACTDEAVAALQHKFQTEVQDIECVESGLCTVTGVDILGDGCPVHVPGMEDIRVELVVSVTLPDEASTGLLTGVDVKSALSEEEDIVTSSIGFFYHIVENGTFTVTVGGIDYPATNQTLLPVVACPSEGYVWIDFYCVPCQIGTFGLDYTCYECPIGSYQDGTGHDKCISCPVGLSTESVGAMNPSQCNVPPQEDDVCASFDTQKTNTEVGWLCGETELVVSRQYLTAEYFTDVFPRIAIHTSEGELLVECVDDDTECIVTIDEGDLERVNTYTVTASVPNSDVTCTKSVVVNYTGLSSNGAILVAFMVILTLLIAAAVVTGVIFYMYRSRKKVQAEKSSERARAYEMPK